MGDEAPRARNDLSGHARNVAQVGQVYGNVVIADGAERVVPRHVPPALARFVNREAELARVSALLGAGGGAPATVVVTGLPGVGKSSLVRQAVHRVGARYPGGELYVDFAELGGDPAGAVADALAWCLRALGVEPAVMPSTLAERAGLYRTLTAREPAVVVLDDVTDPAQVPPLVPKAPGSVVLVATAGRMTELVVDGAETVPLEPLDAEHGAIMLAQLSGRELAGEAVGELVRLCGGLPMAVKVAAARLRARPGLTVEALVSAIARDERVTAVFSVAYRALPADVARMYRLLSLLPSPDFTVELAAATAAVQPVVARELLDELVEAGLISDTGEGRLHAHVLVSRHARARAEAEETEHELTAALHRAAQWLLVRSAWADQVVMDKARFRCTDHDVLLAGTADPFGGNKKRALAWLDSERATLLAMMRAAAEHRWHDLVWQLAEAASALYVQHRYLLDWVESSRLGGEAARLAGNPAAEARLRSFATRAWTDLGDLTTAGRELAESLALARPTGNIRLVASIRELYGRFYDHTAPAQAADEYAEAVELFTSERDARGVAFVTYFLGCSQHAAGRSELALDTLRQALSLIRAVPDQRMEGRALTDLAVVLDALGDRAAALDHVRAAIEVLAAGGYAVHEARAQELLARVTDSRELTRAAVERALVLHRGLRSPRVAELSERLAELTDS